MNVGIRFFLFGMFVLLGLALLVLIFVKFEAASDQRRRQILLAFYINLVVFCLLSIVSAFIDWR
ncbi:hypothetical protein C1O66_04920 [Paucibacter aquatile]|uniref:Uncharacterized protein n=1 Tax=Kinneretia aquatilis TaxID=2070761 RepID=A0A2N8KU18_9BURK|nr:hypothetical protein C1O66_04920 [Paucibacter aquatile]